MSKGLFPGILVRPEQRSGAQRAKLTFRGNIREGRHGWLRLTPAYSLHVVREALRDAAPRARVLDPFSGTGTTALACAEAGFACQALEINPFLVWLGNLKLHRFAQEDVADFLRVADDVTARAGAPSPACAWVPPIHQIEKWWTPPTLATLGKLFDAIRAAAGLAEPVRDLLKVAFCRALIELANVSFAHQSMSFRRLRQHGDHLLAPAENSCAAFVRAARELAASLGAALPVHDCRVLPGDSRDVARHVTRRDFDLVITSPPYPNRMSYIRELRPYMYWLGYLDNGRQAGELDWRAIGGTWGCATSLLSDWRPPAGIAVPYRHFADIVSAIGAREPLLGNYVHKYFCDVVGHVRSLSAVLAPGAVCHFIIGNSKFYDVLLPAEQVYAAILASEGFRRVQVVPLRKRTSKKELYEFAVRAEMG